MSITRPFIQLQKVRTEARKEAFAKYMDFINKLLESSYKYRLPVIMGICSYKEIKEMNYKELQEVLDIAKLKLNKEALETELMATVNG